jgi:hypothetical protein
MDERITLEKQLDEDAGPIIVFISQIVESFL